MSKYIVLDLVSYGNSMNYDQGSSNYQELKKITKWDGRQYTLVSRYALRYSLLETARKNSGWKIDEGEILTTETGKEGKEGSIQPSSDALFSGDILNYPEFDLFGYLITSTSPQNFRTSPVKLSHAVSMTPFNYDALFNANISLANRLRKKKGSLMPNPFTAEEHETYYLYSVVIDVENLGKVEAYKAKPPETKKVEISIDEKNRDRIILKIHGKKIEELSIYFKNKKVGLVKIVIPLSNDKVSYSDKELKTQLEKSVECNEKWDTFIVAYKVTDEEKKERINGLIKSILNLKRSIKGREEDLSPKLIVAGLYSQIQYKTYKDKIALVDETVEESYDEIEEETKDNKRIVKIKHKTTRNTKPVFRVLESGKICKEKISENEILNFVEELLSLPEETNQQHISKGEKQPEMNKVKVYFSPEIEVEQIPDCKKNNQ